MITLKNEDVVFFDVDDTLVMWEHQLVPDSNNIEIVDPYDGKSLYLKPHKPHVKLLRNLNTRGTSVVVWSQSGYQWAEAVVKALGLEDSVLMCMTKPKTYVDDLPVTDWLKDRVYISPDSNWAHTGGTK